MYHIFCIHSSVEGHLGSFQLLSIINKAAMNIVEHVSLLEVGSAGFWWWWVVLVSVSKILTFAFHHLVISGISCYSCLWLELVPPVVLLASIIRPWRLALSWVSVVRVLSAGKLFSCREGAQISGIQTCILAEDEGLKQGLSQKMCCLCSLHA